MTNTERTRRPLRTIGSPKTGRILPLTDEERVLGQIGRGEVIAGAEGARLIAARHQEQYGDVWEARTHAVAGLPAAGGA